MSGTHLQASSSLPPAAMLSEAKNLPHWFDQLKLQLSPITRPFFKLGELEENGFRTLHERFAWAERAVALPLPGQLRDYPATLRRLTATPPDTVAIGRLVAIVIDTRTGFRPPNIGAFIASIAETLSSAGYGLPVVTIACREIRNADPADFRHQLPCEFHFLEASKRAKAMLEHLIWLCETAAGVQDRAHDTLARRAEIEADASAARERTRALLAAMPPSRNSGAK
jgi:hypothetical protein